MIKKLFATFLLLTLLVCGNANAVEVTCSFTATGGSPGMTTMQYPTPSNQSWRDIDNGTLSVYVANSLGDTMNISFYWLNGTLIDIDTNVVNDSYATIEYTQNYTRYQTYEWYITLNSTHYDNQSSTWWFKGEAYRWDVNRDAKTNMSDLQLIASRYGETGTPGWIREDVTSDGEIGLTDITSVCIRYGEEYP